MFIQYANSCQRWCGGVALTTAISGSERCKRATSSSHRVCYCSCNIHAIAGRRAKRVRQGGTCSGAAGTRCREGGCGGTRSLMGSLWQVWHGLVPASAGREGVCTCMETPPSPRCASHLLCIGSIARHRGVRCYLLYQAMQRQGRRHGRCRTARVVEPRPTVATAHCRNSHAVTQHAYSKSAPSTFSCACQFIARERVSRPCRQRLQRSSRQRRHLHLHIGVIAPAATARARRCTARQQGRRGHSYTCCLCCGRCSPPCACHECIHLLYAAVGGSSRWLQPSCRRCESPAAASQQSRTPSTNTTTTSSNIHTTSQCLCCLA